MTTRRTPKAAPLDAKRFPALSDFLRGYLHEDFEGEYGSAVGALAAFLRDAGDEDVAAVRREGAEFWDAARGLPLRQLQRHISLGLGAAWSPATSREAEAFFAALASVSGPATA